MRPIVEPELQGLLVRMCLLDSNRPAAQLSRDVSTAHGIRPARRRFRHSNSPGNQLKTQLTTTNFSYFHRSFTYLLLYFYLTSTHHALKSHPYQPDDFKSNRRECVTRFVASPKKPLRASKYEG